MGSHDDDAPRTRAAPSPANRLGLDYRQPPRPKVAVPRIDVHTHVHQGPTVGAFFEAATLYGVERVVSMTPLDEVAALRAQWPDRLAFIAIPRWREMACTADFQRQWLADLAAFRALGARWMKFWMAPPMRGQHGVTLRDAFFEPLIRSGLDLGLHFMVHIGDPDEWFAPGARYADAAKFGTKRAQYPQLEWLLDTVAPRHVVAAHLGGSPEDPAFLQELLDRHPNLLLDSSATKWVVRAIARHPAAMREFLLRNQDRVLFGSDVVVGEKFDFEHYASRYWVHRQLWETAYDGESPIEDPDAGPVPRLRGLNLPGDVLARLYRANAERVGLC